MKRILIQEIALLILLMALAVHCTACASNTSREEKQKLKDAGIVAAKDLAAAFESKDIVKIKRYLRTNDTYYDAYKDLDLEYLGTDTIDPDVRLDTQTNLYYGYLYFLAKYRLKSSVPETLQTEIVHNVTNEDNCIVMQFRLDLDEGIWHCAYMGFGHFTGPFSK